jgi:hypothetical protein
LFFQSRVNATTQILIEAETSGAFAKNPLEAGLSPDRAFSNALSLAGQVGLALSEQLTSALGTVRAEVDFAFGIKCDPAGNVMIAKSPGDAQFAITVRWMPDT